MRAAQLFALVAALAAGSAVAESFDLVLQGGRAMDPETGLDAVRDVGVRGDRIASISEQPLQGARVLDVRGLVVAPGFIDLHQHQQDDATYRLKALDGVTTVLELETGVPDVARFIEVRRGRTLINFGAAASHEAARVQVWSEQLPASTYGAEAAIPDPNEGPVTQDPATADQLTQVLALLRAQLNAGSLGIGVGLEYTPGATRHEVIEVFRLAAEFARPVFVHQRSGGLLEPGSSVEAVGEVIAAAAVTGAPAHIVHINSMCMRDTPECLAMIGGARARGLDVTTEAYPYGAFMTVLGSAVFSAGWREHNGMDYSDVELPETGERLTRERFEELRARPEPLHVLGHRNPQEVVDAILAQPLAMIASDGIAEHPRNAGSFARVLARNVRAQGSISMMDAMRKMSLMPAQRLESATAAARRKGRLQVGADADIVVFDAAHIEDRATFRDSRAASVGMRYVLVAGVPIVEQGRVVEGAAPGRAVVADATR